MDDVVFWHRFITVMPKLAVVVVFGVVEVLLRGDGGRIRGTTRHVWIQGIHFKNSLITPHGDKIGLVIQKSVTALSY